MASLKPLEFCDCVVDGPHFRAALIAHQKELKKFGKRVKDVYSEADRVFKAMEQLQQAMSDFSTSLVQCYLNPDGPDDSQLTESDKLSSHNLNQSLTKEVCDYAETDDERVIRTAFTEFSKIINNVEAARRLMLDPMKETILGEITELRSVWLNGSKTDPKAFQKNTTNFLTKLDKYLAHKPKDQLPQADDQMRQDRQYYISKAFEYVTNVHEAEERKKSKFVQTISLFMQMLGNFYHQAFEQFQDSHLQRKLIDQATQRSAENFNQISLETKELQDKLLTTPWEQIQTVDSTSFREGYLFVLNKKAMKISCTKYFCTYKRDVKQLDMLPYVQGRSTSDLVIEQYSVKTCVRRSSDSIERRFCFDVEVENRSTPLTLQAQSPEDLAQWLQIMDGQEPQYVDPHKTVVKPDRTFLSPQGCDFFYRLLEAIEKKDLTTPGIYRISGVKSKISSLVHHALSPTTINLQGLLDCDIHLLTGTVKYFVRHLDEPLMTFDLHDDLLDAVKRSPEQRLGEVQRLLNQLPSRNLEVLGILMHHLAKVSHYSSRNNMNSSNLAIVFAPSLMRSREESVAAIMNTKFYSTAIQLMIDNCDSLFPPNSPPVNGITPEAPLIEPVYSTPVIHISKDPPAFHLTAKGTAHPSSAMDSPNNCVGKFESLHLSSEPDPIMHSISASGDQLAAASAINVGKLRRIQSANTTGGKVLLTNRDVRRKPAAPPAPKPPPRPSPPEQTLSQTEPLPYSISPVADRVPSAEPSPPLPQQEQQPRSMALTPHVNNEPEMTSPDTTNTADYL